MYTELYYSFYKLGYGLSKLHQKFMLVNSRRFLTESLTHNDLHMENVFVDPKQNYLVTLIDNETFAKGLNKPISVAVDLLLLYGFSISHFKGEYRHPKEISESIWHAVMFKPFIEGYIKGWPEPKQLRVWQELKDIYLTGLPNLKTIGDRALLIDVFRYKTISNRFAKPVFDEVAQELTLFVRPVFGEIEKDLNLSIY